MKLRLVATSVIRSPRYYGQFFWSPGKNRHTFSCKKKNLVLTGSTVIKRGYPSLENSRGNETTHAILLTEGRK